MMGKKVRARARVQVTVEIDVDDVWGEDCAIAQVHKQAKESARNALQCGLILNYTKMGHDQKTAAKIVSEPLVTSVLVEEDR